MGFLAWIIVGLLAGAIAKAIMPGTRDEPGSWLGTIGLGILGAIIGGMLSGALFGGGGATGVNLSSILVAVMGACVLIGALRLIQR